jgi:hypothetical protein
VDLKAQIDHDIMIVGYFSTPLSPVHKSSRTPQNINKETSELNDTIDQMNLTYIYRVFHPAAAQYAFISAANGIFSKKRSRKKLDTRRWEEFPQSWISRINIMKILLKAFYIVNAMSIKTLVPFFADVEK